VNTPNPWIEAGQTVPTDAASRTPDPDSQRLVPVPDDPLAGDDPAPIPTDIPQATTPAPGRADPGPGGCGLVFEHPGSLPTAVGPLVIVCGLHGGAGTSTLAYAVAAQAALESPAPVLLCESEAASGDIALLSSAVSPLSLSELAAARHAGRKPPRPFLARAGALRVIAGVPAPPLVLDDGAVPAILASARRRHGLTVVDAGVLRAPGTRALLQAATHVVWITTAEPGTAARARALLASPLVPSLAARQLLVVRGGRRGPLDGQRRDWRRLAEDHCERLVFVHDSDQVCVDHVDLGERRMRSTLTALAGFLTGPITE
jgi:hypothetical protein